MIRLETYLSENYKKEKEQQKAVWELIEKVIPTYEKYFDKKGWAYKFGDEPQNVSTSTVAMIAFSMYVLISGKLDLVIDETEENFLKDYCEKNGLLEKFRAIFDSSLSLIIDVFKSERKEGDRVVKKEFTFKSTTYGENDPLTLMWVRYLIDNGNDKSIAIKEDFDKACKGKVKEIFKTLYSNKNDIEYSSTIDRTHIFPLLKIVQLYFAMTSSEEKRNNFYKNIDKEEFDKYVNVVGNTFENCLHNQLSLSSIENSNFDAAELVFSLEGLLLLDFNRDNFDQGLLDRVFKVIKERQAVSLYWRPLKPFVTNDQGMALLPLSVEIATSLIRICRLLGKRGGELFSRNYEIFERYTEWLRTRVTVYQCNTECSNCKTKSFCSKNKPNNDKKFYGWCSEHIYSPNVIHQWETSQVLVYLFNFNDMLQKRIAHQSFEFANFSSKDCGKNKEAWTKWEEKEPVSKDGFEVYKYIRKNYVEESNYFSMLLYGPPGTGKSTIAEKIAETKGWPLVTITPSDFIANGADQLKLSKKYF
jgi:hypothetical protein